MAALDAAGISESIGYASARPSATSVVDAFTAADLAMYADTSDRKDVLR